MLVVYPSDPLSVMRLAACSEDGGEIAPLFSQFVLPYIHVSCTMSGGGRDET